MIKFYKHSESRDKPLKSETIHKTKCELKYAARRDFAKLSVWVVLMLVIVSVSERFSLGLLSSEVVLISIFTGVMIDFAINIIWERNK